MHPRYALLGAFLVAGSVCAARESLALPLLESRAAILLEGMPSFSQRNKEFIGGGKTFCGPTAASNALMWLADRGYPNLKPAAEDDSRAQKEMIQQLAGYMGTYREGTSLSSFKCGINAYLRAAGYSSKAWAYTRNSFVNSSSTPPDISLVNAVSAGNTVMWFSLGYYTFNEANKRYTRGSGHWVTLVGYGKNSEGQDDPDSYVIADPESPNAHKYVTLSLLNEGRLSNGRSSADAKGYFNLVASNGASAGRSLKYCIVESIQALTIE